MSKKIENIITVTDIPCRCYLSAFAFCGLHGNITDEMRKEAKEKRAFDRAKICHCGCECGLTCNLHE